MSLVEFIGFIISLVAILFLMIKNFREDRFRRLNPEEAAKADREKEKAMRILLKSMHIEAEDEKEKKPAQKPVEPIKSNQCPAYHHESGLEKHKKEALIEKRKLKTSIEAEEARFEERLLSRTFRDKEGLAGKYEVFRRQESSRGADLLRQLPSRKQMLIYHELFGKPLALRTFQDER